ncbi:hypothetical protein L085_07430 [Serratia sp. FS14]|nr:hypothetical protein L085_07430 [Serratia sp. FS14]
MKKLFMVVTVLMSIGNVTVAFAYPDPVCTTPIKRYEIKTGVFKMCCMSNEGVVWCPPYAN